MNVASETTELNTSLTQSRSMTSLRTLLLVSISCATMALTTGCSKKTQDIPAVATAPTTTETIVPPTATITADPLAIDLGQTVVLNWRSTSASVVTIDGIGQVPVNGTQTVSPSSSTNFHLTAKGDGGTVEANVRVTVRVPVAPTPGDTVIGPSSTTITDAEFQAAVKDMFFDYDSFELRPDAQSIASQSAAFLVQHPNVRVLIGGYADERGSAEYNLALGENRANAAKNGLIQAGVAPARIRVISYGKEKQFCTESTEACWQENRRAQFTIDR